MVQPLAALGGIDPQHLKTQTLQHLQAVLGACQLRTGGTGLVLQGSWFRATPLCHQYQQFITSMYILNHMCLSF